MDRKKVLYDKIQMLRERIHNKITNNGNRDFDKETIILSNDLNSLLAEYQKIKYPKNSNND